MSPPAPPGCDVTVLRWRSGVLTKRTALSCAADWRVTGFPVGVWFSARERPVSPFGEWEMRRDRISRDPGAAIIRGKLLLGVDARRCRRLCRRAAYAEGVQLKPCARQGIALNNNSLPEPIGLAFAITPEGVEHGLRFLLDPFAGARTPADQTIREILIGGLPIGAPREQIGAPVAREASWWDDRA